MNPKEASALMRETKEIVAKGLEFTVLPPRRQGSTFVEIDKPPPEPYMTLEPAAPVRRRK